MVVDIGGNATGAVVISQASLDAPFGGAVRNQMTEATMHYVNAST
jgi:hypothetical protein